MGNAGAITMTMRDLDRLKVIQAIVDGTLKLGRAAERLGLRVRLVRRLVRRVQAEGAAGLASRCYGRPSNNRMSPDLVKQTLEIIRARYADFGPTLACEKLLECHGINLSKETVRKLMAEAGLWIPRRLRSPTIYQPRNRRHRVGELIQMNRPKYPRHWRVS